MSANASDNLSKTQTYNYNPASKANLKMWEPGKSANPGGNHKRTIHADAVYQRLGQLQLDELKALKTDNAVETAIARSIIAACEASDWQEANAALKQLILCLDGSPKKSLDVNISVSVETKQTVLIACYGQLYDSKSLEEIVSEVTAIKLASGDERLALIASAIEADENAIAGFYDEVEREVTGK